MLYIKEFKKCPCCKKVKPVSEWGANRAQKDGLHVYCKVCARVKNKERDYKRNRNPIRMEFQKRYQAKKRFIRRIAVLEKMGNACIECGYSDNHAALQIDHIEPILRKNTEKYKEVGANVYNKIYHGRIDMATLQLLCANCHAIKTYEKDRPKYRQGVSSKGANIEVGNDSRD